MRTMQSLVWVAGLALAASAQGQYRPAAGGGYGGTMNRGGTGAYGQGRANQVNPALQADQQQVASLSTSLHQAQSALETAVTKAAADFHKTPDYVTAQKAVDDAAADVQKARDAVLAGLRTQADYKAAAARESGARAKLEELKSNGADRDAILTQSNEVLKVGGDTSRMEREALDADPAYKDAIKKLADAHAALVALDDTFTASLKNDANISSLTQKRDDAKTQLVAAQAKLKSDQTGNSGMSITPNGGAGTGTPLGRTTPGG